PPATGGDAVDPHLPAHLATEEVGHQAVEAVAEGGLAGAAGTEDDGELTGTQPEVDVDQRRPALAPIGERHTPQLSGGCRHRMTTPPSGRPRRPADPWGRREVGDAGPSIAPSYEWILFGEGRQRENYRTF